MVPWAHVVLVNYLDACTHCTALMFVRVVALLPTYPLLVLHLGGLAVFRRSLCEHGPYSLGAVDAAANLSGRAKDQP